MFDIIWNEIKNNNILGYKKTLLLYNEIIECVNLNGSTAEIGVFEGHTSKLIKIAIPDKMHYLYHTFCAQHSNVDIHKNGEFNCNLVNVKKNIKFGNIIYKVGIFPDTFDEKFSMVYSDTATYTGATNTLRYFCNRMVCGGKIIFYVDNNCMGVKNAIQEFIERETNIDGFIITINSCFVIFTKKMIMI
jgi:hypothetical protein